MNLKLVFYLIVGVWIGLVLGLSFIEAPLKFTAPGITTELGLGIGQIIFSVSHKIQICFCLLALGLVSIQSSSLSNLGKWSLITLVLILISHSALLPILDHRANLTIQGTKVSSSYHHTLFVVLEVAKIITLIILFFNNKTYD